MKQSVLEFQTLLESDKNRRIVGVNFIFSKNEYENCNVKEATHKMFFCMMAKAAATGHAIKVSRNHLYCNAASEVLGFSEPTYDVRSGKRQFERNMYSSVKISHEIQDSLPYLVHEVYGMCLQPLENFDRFTDVVMIFCKPYTAMRIIQGYTYYFGYAKNILFSGMGGVCSELMARSYKNQDINVSFLCSGTRFAAEWKDDEVGIAFPGNMFDKILEGIKRTVNTFEPDDKKQEIKLRSKDSGVDVTVNYGDNYHGSSLGVAKIGTEGYRKKKVRLK